MRRNPWLLGLAWLAAGSVQAQLDTGPAGDAPFRQLPPPSAMGGEATAPEILAGTWGSSQGRTYQLTGGSFSRDGSTTMRLDCRRRTDIETITPVFECRGTWYQRDGAEGGGYRGKLYWSGPRQSWYLEGAYSHATVPDRWYGLNYGPGEGTEPVLPLIYRDRGSAKNPGDPPSRVPDGLWASGDTRYRVGGGIFWRGDLYPTVRLACDPADDDPDAFDCSGSWYGNTGEQQGSYKGRLSWIEDPGHWFFKGLYNYLAEPGRWYGRNFTQLEGPGGGRPSAPAAERPAPTVVPPGSTTATGSSPAPDDSTDPVPAGGNPGSGNPSRVSPTPAADRDDILDGVDDPKLATCLGRAYDALNTAKLKVTYRRDNALFGHSADFRVRIRCPGSGAASIAVTVISRGARDPVPLRDAIVGAMQ